MRWAALAGCWLFIALGVSCGGRSVTTDGEGSDGPGGSVSNHAGTRNSTGASSNQGGASSTGARPGTGTGGSRAAGGTSAGGAVSTGGTFTMGGACACPPIACGPGTQPVPDPKGCCYHCEGNCQNTACPDIGCGPGSHAAMVPGQCCPICIQDNCKAQQASYQEFRRQLVEKYSSLGCMTDADCGVYWEKNQCAVGCGIVMPNAAIGNLDMNLQSMAQQTCSPDCPMPPQPPCDPPVATCFHNLCE